MDMVTKEGCRRPRSSAWRIAPSWKRFIAARSAAGAPQGRRQAQSATSISSAAQGAEAAPARALPARP